jgi:hypothetical protein
MSSGTGDFSHSGIYVGDTLENLVNQGLGSDIRGTVSVGGNPGLTTVPDGLALKRLRLTGGGSIIGATVFAGVNSYEATSQFNRGGTITQDAGNNFTQPYFRLVNIELSGNGGIIGSRFVSSSIGTIETTGGFGFINNLVTVLGDGKIHELVADGYGIRNSELSGGATMDKITALGNGQQLDANEYTASVRPSAFYDINPNNNEAPNAANDLYKALGITPNATKRGFATKSGVLADTTITSSRDLGDLRAWAIQARVVPSVLNAQGDKVQVDNGNILYPMRVAFGNSINSITTTDGIYGASITAGTIKLLQTGNDLYQARVSTSSRMRVVSIGGTVKGNSTIFANGVDGQIENLSVKRSLLGNVSASVKIGSVNVGRDIGSQNFKSSGNIDSLVIGNDVLDGANIIANKQIANLSIGDDLNAGAVIKAKSLLAFHIGGDQAGSLQIG